MGSGRRHLCPGSRLLPLPWIAALSLPLPSCLRPALAHLGLFSIWAAPLACSEVVPQDHDLRTPLILSAPPPTQARVALGPSITGSLPPQWGEEAAAWSPGHSKSGSVNRNTEWSCRIRFSLGEALAHGKQDRGKGGIAFQEKEPNTLRPWGFQY